MSNLSNSQKNGVLLYIYINHPKEDHIGHLCFAPKSDLKERTGLTVDEIDEKLNELKMYKIVTYQHKFNGHVFDKYVILKISYQGNESWDPNLKWDKDVYFIIKETDVEEISAK